MSDYNSSLPIRTENDGDVVVKVGDATVPSQQLEVDSSGRVTVKIQDSSGDTLDSTSGALHISDGGGSLTVDATDLDIRDLVFATDKVDVTGSSVDVTATDLDIRDLDATQDNVAISDGVDTLAVNADGSINSVVTATDLDIRDLTHVSDSVKVGDGTDFLAVNTDGSINVVLQEDVGTEIVNYDTTASLASSASDNHDWTSAAASKLYQVWASASGKLKIEVQIETAAASNVFNTIAVGFNSTATPNIDLDLSKYAAVPNGARVRVIRTNLDNQAQDVYSTIIAVQG